MTMIVDILGWVYFSCWSISFYPQIILNYSRGSCQGLSSDFALLNLLGFLAYAIYTCSLSFSTELKNQYQKRWNSSPAIPLQDTIFAIHALALTLFTCIQMIYYSHHTDSASNKLSHACLFFIQFSCFGLLLLLVETVVGSLLMLDVVYYLSGVKMVISFIKYIPQVQLNRENESTVGFSIYNVLLDSAGGICSIAQQIIQAITENNSSIVFGNPIKLGLGITSLLFDFIFILQHYVIYSAKDTLDEEVSITSESNLLKSNSYDALV